ncbi:MAG TPA: thioredoxin family protein [Pyrinomonadaceae bacterium]|nr:thioredoxin family protein [Pyrinomonadaceae bacterium]
MKMQSKFVGIPFVLLLVLSFVSLCLLPETGAARVNSDTVAIGSKVENFTLADADGKQRSFNDLKGKNGALIVFMSAQCPVVKAYAERINALTKDYQAKGISVIGMNSNATESLDYVKSNMTERSYSFPMLIDKGNVIADKFGATVTPEVYLFDKDGKLVYRGAIDNDRSGENITARPLQDAVDATVAGKTVAKTETKAFGCSIKRAAK